MYRSADSSIWNRIGSGACQSHMERAKAGSWDLFSEMNDNSELVWSIPAGETKTIVIPYVAYRQLMSESDWKKLNQDNMKLRFTVVQGSITVNVK